MTESLIQIAVRTVVGLFLGAVGAFVAGLIAGITVHSDGSEVLSGALRIAVIAVFAATASRLAWFGMCETTRQSWTLWGACVVFGAVASWLALLIASLTFERTDFYVLSRDISGAGFFGAVVGANVPAVVYAAQLARRRAFD